MNIQIPVNSLKLRNQMLTSTEGEEETIKPEVNDPVDFSIEGVVTAISGNTATVNVRFINGERPEHEAGESSQEESKEPSEADLKKAAMEADAEEE